jgi:formimidoylglutamate deiminase
MAPHSLRAVDLDLLSDVLKSHPTPCPIHIHIAEQTKEIEDCIAWCGRRPVEWLLSGMEVNSNWCLVHATHMTDHEITDLAATGAVAGLCPTTEANLGDGLFPAEAYFAQSGAFGIGSDSQISVDPVEELRWLEYGQRLIKRSRNVLTGGNGQTSTGRRLFSDAVLGGAQASGRASGRIEPGCRADLITLDTAHPLLYGREGDALLDSWIFSGNSSLVQDVFVGGRWVVSSGVHPLQDTIAAAFKTTLDELTLRT